jgi:hypothetical protein
MLILENYDHLTWAKHIKTKSETNARVTWKKINTVNRKQTPATQSSTQTHLDQ